MVTSPYKNVSFYGQGPLNQIQRDYASDPRNQMFQELMQKGVGNVQSPLEGLTKALTQGVGGYFAGKSAGEMQDRQTAANEAMIKALSGAKAKEFDRPTPDFVGPMQGSPGGLQGVIDAGVGTGNQDIMPFLQNAQMMKMQQDQAAQQAEIDRRNKLADAITLKKTAGPPTGLTGRPAAGIQYNDEITRLAALYPTVNGKEDPRVTQMKVLAKLAMLRDIGGSFLTIDASDPMNTKGGPQKTLAPNQTPEHVAEVKTAEEEAKTAAAAGKAENTALGKAVGESNMALYETVQSGLDTIDKANDLINHLNTSDAITGAGAEMFKGIERLKSLMGSDIAAGKVANTEILNAMMGSDVFGMIKSLGIGARGLDTPAEREFMREVLTGTITLNKGTIIRLAEIRRDVGQRAIDKWNDKTDRGELDRFYEATGIEKSRLGKPKVVVKSLLQIPSPDITIGGGVSKLPEGVTEEDISQTMKDNNMTREQVFQALGVK
jgi:hypothetical protein